MYDSLFYQKKMRLFDNHEYLSKRSTIVGNPLSLIKRRGYNLPKVQSLAGTKFFVRKGDKPEKGGGLM